MYRGNGCRAKTRAEKRPIWETRAGERVYFAGRNNRTVQSRWWFSVPQQPKPHFKFSTFPISIRDLPSTLNPFPSRIYTVLYIACPCTEYIPLVAATKCPPRCFPRLDVPTQRIVRGRGGRNLLQALQRPPQLLNGSQSFRNVPNCLASCQSSRILPAKSIILSSNSMPRTYANLALLYHTSAMPSPFAAPCAFLVCFLSPGVAT